MSLMSLWNSTLPQWLPASTNQTNKVCLWWKRGVGARGGGNEQGVVGKELGVVRPRILALVS